MSKLRAGGAWTRDAKDLLEAPEFMSQFESKLTFEVITNPTLKEQVSVCRRAAENMLKSAQEHNDTLDGAQHLVDELFHLERLVQEGEWTHDSNIRWRLYREF